LILSDIFKDRRQAVPDRKQRDHCEMQNCRRKVDRRLFSGHTLTNNWWLQVQTVENISLEDYEEWIPDNNQVYKKFG
jgi:hypothetical protein